MADAIARTLVPPAIDPPPPARVDDRGAGQVGARARPRRRLSAHAGAAIARRRGRRCSSRSCARSAPRSPRRSSSPGSSRPLVARWVSRPPPPVADASALASRTPRSSARRRAGPGASSRPSSAADDHCLPPDNFQEDPKPVVAHRTSPTNIGLYLLVDRRRARLRLARASRHCSSGWRRPSPRWSASSASGATSTTGTTPRRLRPLEPRYVSTVDSGNLAGAPAGPRQRLPRRDRRPPARIPACSAGSGTRCSSSRKPRACSPTTGAPRPSRRRHLDETCAVLIAALHEPPADPAEWSSRVRHLALHADTLVDMSRALTAERGDPVDCRRAGLGRGRARHHRRPRARCSDAPALGVRPRAPRPTWRHSVPSDPRRSTPADRPGRWPRSPIAALATAARAAVREDAGAGEEAIARLDRALDGASAVLLGRRGARRSTAARSLAPREARRRDGVRLPLRPHPQDLLDRLPRHGRHPRPERYDLLASEARLTSFIAIAKGDVPVSHWFHLGRPMTPVGIGSALLSWSRLDVRVPDAGARHALPGGQPAGRDLPPRRSAVR